MTNRLVINNYLIERSLENDPEGKRTYKLHVFENEKPISSFFVEYDENKNYVITTENILPIMHENIDLISQWLIDCDDFNEKK